MLHSVRSSGILLPVPSLPSPYPIGGLGSEAYQFVRLLEQSGQSIWQVLPLNPTLARYHHSPYSSSSTFAGNPLLICPEMLKKDGLLREKDIKTLDISKKKPNSIDYNEASQIKGQLLDKAWTNFFKLPENKEFEKFCTDNKNWLEDFALFTALDQHFAPKPWTEWPKEIKQRNKTALKKCLKDLGDLVQKNKLFQFLFFRQWFSLKNFCRAREISIIGDLPIYVSQDSCDVWANQEIFQLDPDGLPAYQAGVPPDYFSSTGQLWGNPIYDWEKLQSVNFSWWIDRIEHQLELFDLLRIDHFRGLVGYWSVPADEKTAVKGQWVQAPFYPFFKRLKKRFPQLPIIAEDLGQITPDVSQAITYFQLPGMKVLLFAFGEDNPDNPFLPHNYSPNYLVYTGTHDTNTAKGWFEQEINDQDKERLSGYLGKDITSQNVSWELIRLGQMSTASLMVIPMQDILNLGSEARINQPGTTSGNWLWRVREKQLRSGWIKDLREMTRTYGRTF